MNTKMSFGIKRGLMIIVFVSAAGSGMLTGIAQKQSASKAPDPTVEQIIEKYEKAIGGKSAVEKHTSLTAKGDVEITGDASEGVLKGVVELYSKAPNIRSVLIRIPGHGVLLRQVFDGASAWQRDPEGGLKDMSGEAAVVFKRNSDFHKNVRLRELFPKMQRNGRQDIQGHDTFVVAAWPDGGSHEDMYFDSQSGLLVRVDYKPSNGPASETYYDDYREVDGIKLPFYQRQVTPAYTTVVKLSDVQYDLAIDDAKFKKPPKAR